MVEDEETSGVGGRDDVGGVEGVLSDVDSKDVGRGIIIVDGGVVSVDHALHFEGFGSGEEKGVEGVC